MPKRKRDGEVIENNHGSSQDVQESTDNGVRNAAFTHHDYNVGWICALSKEQTAAIIMLDHTHPDLPKSRDDRYSYTLGSIGKHNVVIACLPKGQYGTITAAKVATWMTSTFPSIRVGLMVGIGGGVPPKVRLGDAVISTPVAEYTGVVHWDMGKSEEGGHFKRIGSLNIPPTALLTALSKLETQHAIRGPKIAQYLTEAEKKYPFLDPKYTRSDSLNDTLDAEERERRPGHARVHHGLVPSGNQVINNSTVRDRLDESLGGNVLCVEMEAAGLMNDFPCVVVRGICDYADSSKNKDWQEHAVATAAACAKELLEIVDPIDIEHTREARYVVDMLQNIVSTNSEIVRTQEQQMSEEKRNRLFQWLSKLSPSARHSESRKQRVEGTGTWLLKSSKFVDWLSTEPNDSVVCCFGNPGVGKTIVASLVVDELEKHTVKIPEAGLAYMYCDYRDQKAQTAEAILGAILQQSLRRLDIVPEEVWNIHIESRGAKDGENLALRLGNAKFLLGVMSETFKQLYVCIDAIDELDDIRGVMGFLRDRSSNVQLFLTGRPHMQSTIKAYLRELDHVIVEAKQDDIE